MLYSQYIEIERQEGGKTEEDRDTEKEAHRQTEYRERERERDRVSQETEIQKQRHTEYRNREREIWRQSQRCRHKGTQTDRNTDKLRQKRGGRGGRTGGGGKGRESLIKVFYTHLLSGSLGSLQAKQKVSAEEITTSTHQSVKYSKLVYFCLAC